MAIFFIFAGFLSLMYVLCVFIYFQTAEVIYLLAPIMSVSLDQVITDTPVTSTAQQCVLFSLDLILILNKWRLHNILFTV